MAVPQAGDMLMKHPVNKCPPIGWKDLRQDYLMGKTV